MKGPGIDHVAFAIPRSPKGQEDRSPLRLYNLLNDLGTLAPLLVDQLRQELWLDGYLVAAGMNQVVEDYLHRDVYSLSRVARNVWQVPVPVPVSRLAAACAVRSATVGFRLRTFRPAERRASEWQRILSHLAQRLAHVVVDEMGLAASATPVSGERATIRMANTGLTADLPQAGEALLHELDSLPSGLRRSVMRLPTCFRSLDQHPIDCYRIIRRFVDEWPERSVPLLVVGVRTSGSYLGPLYGAVLCREGYRDVRNLTIRPNSRLLREERALIEDTIRSGGLLLIADDAPASGGTLAAVAAHLEQLGAPRHSIILLIPLLTARDMVPRTLEPFQKVVLSWHEWAIHDELVPEVVQKTLSELLVGQTIRVSPSDGPSAPVTVRRVEGVERLSLPTRANFTPGSTDRCHVRALFRARLVNIETGGAVDHLIYVKGAGLGYLGRYSLAVTEGIGEFLPDVYGLHNGLLYRKWFPEEQRVRTPLAVCHERLPGRVAAYVDRRRHMLATQEDVSERLSGQHPHWETAADLLGHSFGGASLLVRPVLHRAIRQLLRSRAPSVVDGSMSISQWFLLAGATGDREDDYRKVDFDEYAFSNRDLYCFDATYDLASCAADYALMTLGGAGASCEIDDGFVAILRQDYETLSGELIGDERWLLHQLVFYKRYDDALTAVLAARDPGLAGIVLGEQTGALIVKEREVVRRAMAHVYQDYIERRFFDDVNPSPSGALCALDIDGVLETLPLGFPAITPAGAYALRALTRHGYRPILVTGRSLPEVRERCDRYHLVGGVAEYGAVSYDHGNKRSRDLLSAMDHDVLDRLRRGLEQIQGVYVDDAYRYCVRAYRIDELGRRRALTSAVIERVLKASETEKHVQPILGFFQTDFMVPHVTKRTGLDALATDLGLQSGRTNGTPVVLAVGDTISDIPLFDVATIACAPANADRSVKEAGVALMKRPYQAGLMQAVQHVLGHAPGMCPTCVAQPASRDTHLLLTILGAQDADARGKLIRTVKAAWQTRHA